MRYKITIEYSGTNYNGWQKQAGLFSIQENIERSIKLLTQEDVELFGAGRTDAGVHALAQVAHFDLHKNMPADKIVSGLNFYLRSEYISRIACNYISSGGNIQDIAILDCEIVDENFHARFSAKKRYYRYRILNRRQPTALNSNRVWQVYKPLDFSAMEQTLQYLTGKRDWSSFRDSDCQSKSPIKTIDKVSLYKDGEEIVFEIEAKSFMHHMVRNIVGTMVDVGLGKTTVEGFKNIIEANDRTKAGPTAPACGLYFVKVEY